MHKDLDNKVKIGTGAWQLGNGLRGKGPIRPGYWALPTDISENGLVPIQAR